MTKRLADFFQTSLGKATVGLFSGALSFCFPQIPGYAFAAGSLYYCIHQFRPVGLWIFYDIKRDLSDADPGTSEPG